MEPNGTLLFFLGFFSSTLCAAYLMRIEWQKRRNIEARLDRLYKHLSCGQGYLGCPHGKDCHWSHK